MLRNFALLSFVVILAFCTNPAGKNSSGLTEGRGIIVNKGIVVSDHPVASKIGAEILKKGGNAVDAAIATDLALAVCYPEAGNIGGGGFMLIRTHEGKTDAIDFREKAPGKAGRDMFVDKTGKVTAGLSMNTHLAAGVPGTIDGLLAAHKKYGKLPFIELIQPAIDLASEGFKLSARQARSFNGHRKAFIERNTGKTAFAKDSLWKEGDLLIQPELAETLKKVRDSGREGFYSGVTADLIVKEMIRGNGIVTGNDLGEYRSVWREPLSGNYRGYKIITVAPPSSGGVILLQLLQMVERYDLKEMGFHTPRMMHLLTEAERRSFADRAEFLGDPDFVSVPVEKLLKPDYISERMSSFDFNKASSSSVIGHGNPVPHESEQTTHFSVVDAENNAVAVTTTLNNTFGSGIVVSGAGFLLNDEMDDFSVKPGYPNMYGLVGGEANSIQPGKRMLSSMTPAIVENNGKLFLVVGSPGGSTIPTTVFQVILNVIDYKMDIQDAVNAGRFHHQWLPDTILYEKKAVDSTSLMTLKLLGHTLKARGSIGLVNAIEVLQDGRLEGGADPRGYNSAYGF